MQGRKHLERALLLTAIVYPAFLTWVYFVCLAGSASSVQQVAYSVGKAVQFLLPLVCVGGVCREPLRWPMPNSRGLLAGAVFGLVIVAGMVAVYLGWLRSSGLFGEAARQIGERLSAIGIVNPASFALMAVFYSLIHSLLEEYYWRWFVFGRLRQVVPLAAAIAVSSLAFMAHHVIVLAWYFGWGSPWTWVFSLSTAVGGAYWAWLYARTGSIYGLWLSHLLIDAGIFAVGYDLVAKATSS